MLRTPSLQQPYDEFFSEDPAIIPDPPDLQNATPQALEALDKERALRRKKIETARETGDWSPILVDGQIPGRFQMQPLKGGQYRALVDMMAMGQIGPALYHQLAFRTSYLSIADATLQNVPTKREKHPVLGDIAAESVSDYFDSIDKSLVTELGAEALRRARSLDPKS